MIASASDDRTVRFWQPTIGRMVRFARLPTQPREIAWSIDGSTIFAAGTDGKVYSIDPNKVEIIDERDVVEGWAYAIAVHPGDGSLAVGGINGELKRIELALASY